MHIEREIKLRLTAAAESALAKLAPNRRSVASIYYDTPRQALRRAGIALRLRRDGNRWLQTLKLERAPHAGLAARAEWEVPVRGRVLDVEALPLEEIRRTSGVDLAPVVPKLRPVFETRFTRRSGLVPLEPAGKAELALDKGAVIARGRRESIREAELELVSGEPAALLRYAEKLGYPLAYERKAERGYRLCAGVESGPQRWRLPALDPQRPAAEAFAVLFSAALSQVGTNAAGMHCSSDPEYLHQLRVGLRRLRTALRAFGPVVQRQKPLRRLLRRLAPALGTARDWDVFMKTMEDAQADPKLLRSARRERLGATKAALQTVRSPEFQRFLFRSLRWLHEAAPVTQPTLLQLAPRRLEKLYRKALAKAQSTTPGARHKLRIRLKRLRYACEFFAPCFAPQRVEPYVRRLARLQDLLGELNDIAVARRLCRRLDAEPPARIAGREKRLIRSLEPALLHFTNDPPYWRRPT